MSGHWGVSVMGVSRLVHVLIGINGPFSFDLDLLLSNLPVG